ncbi:MAG: O-antigen ligase family protein [Clostridia bacterium]|nr:O-antigen ligase family protein [Clostridia bacterium]
MNRLGFEIKKGDIKLIEKIFSSKFLVSLLLFPFFKSEAFNCIPCLAEITNVILAIECLMLFFINICSKNKSKFFIMMILFSFWNYIISPLLGGHTSESIYYLLESLGMISFIDIALKVNYKKSISGISSIFTFMVILNFLTLVLFPNGLIPMSKNGNVYLFGLRTGFSLVIIPSFLFNFIDDNINNNDKFSLKTVICLILGLYSLISEWVVTGIIEVFITLILYILFVLRKDKKLNKYIRIIFISIMIINFSMTLIGDSFSIVSFIANLLNKDITLSGRTYIWECAVNKLNQNPLLGYGLESTVNIYGILKPAHNHWLHIGLMSGYIGMIILIISFYFSCLKLKSQSMSKNNNLICVFIISILIGCITEIQLYFPFIYMIFELPYLLEYIDESDEVDQ